MNSLRLLLLLVLPLQLFSQNFYEVGYYIDNNGVRVNGFVNNEYWYNSPETVSFRTSADSETTVLTIDKVAEFGVGTHTKYIRHTVDVDKDRSVNLAYINTAFSVPQYIKKTVFLNTLLEGKANLYSLTLDEDRKFFISSESAPIPVQLVYKKFIDTDSKVRETWEYRSTLYESYRCGDSNLGSLKKLPYTQKAIKEYITAYNSCSGSTNTEFATERRALKLKFTGFAGAVMHNYDIQNAQDDRFGSSSGAAPIVGIDASLILPAHSNRYEIFLRASFETLAMDNFANRNTTSSSQIQDQVLTDVSIINLTIGPRYSFILNQKNRIFVEGQLGYAIISGDIIYQTVRYSDTGKTVHNTQAIPVAGDLVAGLGVGYVFNNKFGLSINSDLTPKNILGTTFILRGTALHNISAQLRYTFN
jgi:hypothetical protein